MHMRKAGGFVLSLALALGGRLGFARSAPSEFRVPKILSRTAAALGQTGHPSHRLTMLLCSIQIRVPPVGRQHPIPSIGTNLKRQTERNY